MLSLRSSQLGGLSTTIIPPCEMYAFSMNAIGNSHFSTKGLSFDIYSPIFKYLYMYNKAVPFLPKSYDVIGLRSARKRHVKSRTSPLFCVMRGSRKFCQRGSNFDLFLYIFCLVDEEREDPNTTIS